jgi:predicted GIY-YIG superfamily endonuclease
MAQSTVYQVYILQNNKGIFYIGLSEDIALRLEQHNRGISKWTRSRGPWSLVWASAPMSLSEARKLERLLKRQKGGSGFYKLTGLTRSSGS